ncbi:hypothetical protein CLV80_104333 [Yoonia maritima]|uniref:Uncharacterized protein n=1 Tax=Yoonia maritima TaxID=1435347 RepID=A0A2T0W0R4_9RHOB|nr:hypothetical protein [Yoonia maritima]PRY78364.1 hypothetical protein CLV80_104333 [Yoonia maritima]
MENFAQHLIRMAFCVMMTMQAAHADLRLKDEQLRVFATCAGRLSATMEFQWMFDGEGSEATKTQRDNMVQLINAIMPADHAREVLNWRIASKSAHAALLTRATFNDDPGDADWAQHHAARLIRECTGLLLS